VVALPCEGKILLAIKGLVTHLVYFCGTIYFTGYSSRLKNIRSTVNSIRNCTSPKQRHCQASCPLKERLFLRSDLICSSTWADGPTGTSGSLGTLLSLVTHSTARSGRRDDPRGNISQISWKKSGNSLFTHN
jgi:hypothetical protein